MPWLKKCLGIDVGSTSVKISEIVTEKSGVRITQIHRASVDLPPGPLDAARMDAIAKLVRRVISENKITTKHAVFSVPGQNVFIRRIRFPRTNEERMHRIVAYEAKQQIPFPPESSLMEYQVFDYGESAEVEVLLAAIKSDIVADFMKLVSKCGLKPVMVSVTSLALFNFHVFDSTPFADMVEALKEQQSAAAGPSDAASAPAADGKPKKGLKIPKMSFGKKKKLDASDVLDATLPDDMTAASLQIDALPPADDLFEEVKGYINIGSQTFDLAIARHGRRKMLGFTRSVAWAGGELTRLLQAQLNIDAAQAEQIKRTDIVLPNSIDLAPEAPTPASEIAVKWAEKIVLEIRKSFDFYIAQPDGMAVDNIVLSGGGAEVKGLAAFIEDRLGIPVEVREAPQNPDIVITNRPEGDDLLTSYLVSFGLALSGLGFGHVTADFLPRELKTIREFKKKKMEIIIMAALLLAIIGLSTLLGTTEISAMRGWLTSNTETLSLAQNDQQQLSTARAARQSVESKITAIGQALGDRAYWLEFMGVLESMKPAGVTFSSMELQPDGNILLSGTAQSNRSYLDMLDAMNNAPDWVKPGSAQIIQQGAAAAGASTVASFVIGAESVWKKTRLEPARASLTPGHWTPTPAPTGTPGMDAMYPDMMY
jgi:Tfp pilus assembly PilM family ATPase/Tfp pilus assembly protein PilN